MNYYYDGKVDSLRFLFPQISWPGVVSDEDAATVGAIPAPTPPSIDRATQKVDTIPGEEQSGEWITWIVRDLSDSEILTNLKLKRNGLLSATDWYGASDVTMPSTVATWRQELRDLPANTADIRNPVFPTEPTGLVKISPL
jgi:hypothetical protein